MSTELLIATFSLGSSILTCGITYGIMKTKIGRLEEDHLSTQARLLDMEMRAEQRFVTLSHFDAVVNPLKESIKEIERDIKKILVIVSRSTDDNS